MSAQSIVIEGLQIYAHHGVLPQERKVGNLFELDIRLDFDASAAMKSDAVEDTVNYARVIDVVEQQMAIPADLLEHVATRIRDAICHEFSRVQGGKITVFKIHPPLKAVLKRVGFILEW